MSLLQEVLTAAKNELDRLEADGKAVAAEIKSKLNEVVAWVEGELHKL